MNPAENLEPIKKKLGLAGGPRHIQSYSKYSYSILGRIGGKLKRELKEGAWARFDLILKNILPRSGQKVH